MTDCEMIKALLPMYIEDECSDEVRTSVEEHLKECPRCQKEYEEMTKGLPQMPVDLPDAKQINPFKKIKAFNRRRNAMIILSVTIVMIIIALLLVKYLLYKNGKTIYCQRDPIVVFEAILDSFYDSDPNSKISLVVAEKDGSIIDYNNHFFEIYDADKERYYQVDNKNISSSGDKNKEHPDSIRIEIVPKTKKDQKPDSIDLSTVMVILRSIIDQTDVDISKASIAVHSYKGSVGYDVDYYYDAITGDFTEAEKFKEIQEGKSVCIIRLIEPTVKVPDEGVLMGDELRIIQIAVCY